jgi:competence protein ComEA
MVKKFFAAFAMFAALAFASFSFAAVDANKATAAELDSVKGIGPAISAKIIDERKKGNFKDWNDMVNRVSGIGEKNAAAFSTNGLTVGGAAYKGTPAAVAAKPDAKADPKADKKKADAEAKAKAKADKADKAKADKEAKAKAKADKDAKAKADKDAKATAKKAPAKDDKKDDKKADAKK